jgi:hypothetical protein
VSLDRPQKLTWFLDILARAHPGKVEPVERDMQQIAHWAWQLGYAMRNLDGPRITYTLTASGRDFVERGKKERKDG